MPSGLIHLTIAELYAENQHSGALSVKSLPDLMLGSISPDAVNLGDMASQEIRYEAHLRSRNIPQWIKNIHEYRTAHEQDFSERPDVLKGLLLHLFTDIAWDERVQPELFTRMYRSGIRYEDRSRAKWKELYILESKIREWDCTQHALDELKKAQPFAVTSVSAEQVGAWQIETLRRYDTLERQEGGVLDTSFIFSALQGVEELMFREYR